MPKYSLYYVLSCKPICGLLDQAPTKDHFFVGAQIDCAHFIPYSVATRQGVSTREFSSSPGAATRQGRSFPLSAISNIFQLEPIENQRGGVTGFFCFLD